MVKIHTTNFEGKFGVTSNVPIDRDLWLKLRELHFKELDRQRKVPVVVEKRGK